RGDVPAVHFQLAVADMSDPVSGAGDLAGYDPVRAAAAGLEIVADVAFGGRVGFRAGRHRIHFGGVDEVHARSLGPIELGEGLGFIVLFAPGHGAQAERADAQVGTAELTLFHGRSLCR